MVAKAAAAANLFLTVPFVLHALGPAQFGAWATLVSLVMFAGFLDFGFGNGTMNLVAAAHCAGFRFAFAGETACGSADVEFMAAGGHVSVEGRDGIADLGFADLSNPPAVPATGFASTPQVVQVGHVYAVRVRNATVLFRVVALHNPDAEREVREKVFGRGRNPLDHSPVPHTVQGGAPVTVTLEWLQ